MAADAAEVLDRFARHYQTGEPMPQALVEKIEAAKTFNQGFATVEYLSSALVDMKLHMKPDGVVDPDAFERETLAELGMPREIVMRHRLPQFSHLFSSDAYSAGYYSYLWSETMDADTWAAFEETGNVWDQATATRFRKTLLSTGNETDRAEAYRAFRGRDPDVNALAQAARLPGQEDGRRWQRAALTLGAVHRVELLGKAAGEAVVEDLANVGVRLGDRRAAPRPRCSTTCCRAVRRTVARRRRRR